MRRLVYVSAEEHNLVRLERWDGHFQLAIETRVPKQVTRPVEADVVAYDLDSLAWGRRERRRFVERLCGEKGDRLLAVHSYNLEADEEQRLLANGVKVFSRLGPTELIALAATFAAIRPASTPAAAHGDVVLRVEDGAVTTAPRTVPVAPPRKRRRDELLDWVV